MSATSQHPPSRAAGGSPTSPSSAPQSGLSVGDLERQLRVAEEEMPNLKKANLDLPEANLDLQQANIDLQKENVFLQEQLIDGEDTVRTLTETNTRLTQRPPVEDMLELSSRLEDCEQEIKFKDEKLRRFQTFFDRARANALEACAEMSLIGVLEDRPGDDDSAGTQDPPSQLGGGEDDQQSVDSDSKDIGTGVNEASKAPRDEPGLGSDLGSLTARVDDTDDEKSPASVFGTVNRPWDMSPTSDFDPDADSFMQLSKPDHPPAPPVELSQRPDPGQVQSAENPPKQKTMPSPAMPWMSQAMASRPRSLLRSSAPSQSMGFLPSSAVQNWQNIATENPGKERLEANKAMSENLTRLDQDEVKGKTPIAANELFHVSYLAKTTNDKGVEKLTRVTKVDVPSQRPVSSYDIEPKGKPEVEIKEAAKVESTPPPHLASGGKVSEIAQTPQKMSIRSKATQDEVSVGQTLEESGEQGRIMKEEMRALVLQDWTFAAALAKVNSEWQQPEERHPPLKCRTDVGASLPPRRHPGAIQGLVAAKRQELTEWHARNDASATTASAAKRPGPASDNKSSKRLQGDRVEELGKLPEAAVKRYPYTKNFRFHNCFTQVTFPDTRGAIGFGSAFEQSTGTAAKVKVVTHGKSGHPSITLKTGMDKDSLKEQVEFEKKDGSLVKMGWKPVIKTGESYHVQNFSCGLVSESEVFSHSDVQFDQYQDSNGRLPTFQPVRGRVLATSHS